MRVYKIYILNFSCKYKKTIFKDIWLIENINLLSKLNLITHCTFKFNFLKTNINETEILLWKLFYVIIINYNYNLEFKTHVNKILLIRKLIIKFII